MMAHPAGLARPVLGSGTAALPVDPAGAPTKLMEARSAETGSDPSTGSRRMRAGARKEPAHGERCRKVVNDMSMRPEENPVCADLTRPAPSVQTELRRGASNISASARARWPPIATGDIRVDRTGRGSDCHNPPRELMPPNTSSASCRSVASPSKPLTARRSASSSRANTVSVVWFATPKAAPSAPTL